MKIASVADRIRNYYHCTDSDVDEAADVIDALCDVIELILDCDGFVDGHEEAEKAWEAATGLRWDEYRHLERMERKALRGR